MHFFKLKMVNCSESSLKLIDIFNERLRHGFDLEIFQKKVHSLLTFSSFYMIFLVDIFYFSQILKFVLFFLF